MSHSPRSDALALGRSLCESGWSFLDQNSLSEAERAFRASLQHVPGHPIASAGLGLVRFRQGSRRDGLALLEQAASAAPQEAFIAHLLGESLCLSGRWQDAVPFLERAVALRPDFAESHNALGNALSALGRPGEAVRHYQTAIKRNPALAEPFNNLGLAFAALDRHDEAVGCYRSALALQPHYDEARLNLGLSLLALNRAPEALAQFDAAAKTSSGPAVLGRGMALQAMGRLADARGHFEQAVLLRPDDPPTHLALAGGKTFQPDDPQIAVMEALLARSVPPWHETCLHFALFKAYDDTKRYDAAFAELDKANRSWRPHLAYDEKAELQSLARIAGQFTPQILQHPAAGASALPVFVVGMPRSGTSLVEQILASHPEVHGAGELGDLGAIATGGYTPDKRSFAGLLADKDACAAVGRRYLEAIRARAPQASRIVDKLPANFMLIGLIRLALPQARIIHIRRNAMDTCFSCYAHLFKGSLNYTYDLGELGRFYRAYETLMAHWRAVLPAGAMLEVDYETLVCDFDAEARRLVAYCGLAWDARCTAFHKTERPVHTASAFQVRKPLYATAIGHARHYEQYLGGLARALNPRWSNEHSNSLLQGG